MSATPAQITLSRNGALPLTRQIASQIESLVKRGEWRPGQRLPSVRAFAAAHSTSTHTVVEAYSYLVARGVAVSRRGAGYYVAERGDSPVSGSHSRLRESLDPRRLGREILADSPATLRLGGGAVSSDWVDHVELDSAFKKISRGVLPRFGSYGTTQGYAPLRELLAQHLGAKGIKTTAAGILMSQGATQALDLVIRLLVKPGQTVLVDDPGYFQTTWALKTQGASVVGVPRLAGGPDPQAFERLCIQTKAMVFFTQSALQNPTGSVLSLAVAHEILRIAERHSVVIVEDDVSGDLVPDTAPRLAMLDQLRRVIYIGSFSKSLSPSLRVGYLATNRAELSEELTHLKMLSSYVSCEPIEAIVHSLVADGHYARHVRRIDRRLKERASMVIPRLAQLGFSMDVDQPYVGGTFVWVRHRDFSDAMTLTDRASNSGILLAPGCAFRPNQDESPYFRFSLPLCVEQAMNALAGVVTPNAERNAPFPTE